MSPVGEDVTRGSAPAQSRTRRIHPAWFVAATALVALIGAAGFRAAPGVLMVPLEEEFGWSLTEMSVAVTVNLLLFGLTAPFAAALMQRFGIRAVTAAALMLIAAGSALSVPARDPCAARRDEGARVLGPRRGVRHLRRLDERSRRHAFHPQRP